MRLRLKSVEAALSNFVALAGVPAMIGVAIFAGLAFRVEDAPGVGTPGHAENCHACQAPRHPVAEMAEPSQPETPQRILQIRQSLMNTLAAPGQVHGF
jgi:hypothetical protein